MSPNSRHHKNVAGPTRARDPFTFSAAVRVGFSDTDAQGIVYYGRYAPYFDVARVEFWRYLGLNTHKDDYPGDFVMRAFDIEYHAPATFDDELEVFVRCARLGTSSITFEFEVVLVEGDKLLATATQTMVNVDLEARRPLAIASEMRALIERFERGDFTDSRLP